MCHGDRLRLKHHLVLTVKNLDLFLMQTVFYYNFGRGKSAISVYLEVGSFSLLLTFVSAVYLGNFSTFRKEIFIRKC